jgi:ribose-phosphate pyrophosphokinase
MKKVVLIGEETNLLNNIHQNNNIEIIDFRKYKFSNDNFIYQLEGKVDFDEVSIVADLSKNLHENLWGLFFALDFLKGEKVNIQNLVFPYFPYSRSNKEHKDTTFNLRAIVNFLNLFPINKITTFDTHFGNQKIGLKSKLKVIKQQDLFNQEIKISDNTIFIGPDEGSEKRINELSNSFGRPGIVLVKKRTNHSETVNLSIKKEHVDLLKNIDKVTIFDDEICSGNTIKTAIEKILEINENIKIDIFITHSFLKNDTELITYKSINKLYVTNSVDNFNNSSEKVIVKDLSKLIIKEINA